MFVSDYIKKLLSHEEYAFSLDELLENIPKSKQAIASELSRLIAKKEIINLRKGFYLIITPRYSKTQKLPLQLYCEKLFKYLDRKYYIAFFSASKFHGASHQQIHKDYIIIEQPKLKDISKHNFDIKFFTTRKISNSNIQIKKSDAGYFKISSPVLTIVDLIYYQTKLGGINRMLINIEELSELISLEDLDELLGWYPNVSTIQRLGFVLEMFNQEEVFLQMIYSKLNQKTFYPVLLSPNNRDKPGAVNNRWKVDVNVKLESDL